MLADRGWRAVQRRPDRARRAAAAGAVQGRDGANGWPRALGRRCGAVNVKATTNEGMGFVGRGEGIAALAVAHDRAGRLTWRRRRSASRTRSAARSATWSRASRDGWAIYVCGPTVYGRIHVGNARPYVMFALFKRFLEHEGYDVTLVENVTDINDKIYVAARDAGRRVGGARARDDGACTGPTPTASGWADRTASRCDRDAGRDHRPDRGADRGRPRLPVRRRRLLQRAQLRRSTASSPTGASRTSRRRTRASRRASRR